MLNLERQRKKIEGNKRNGHYTPMNIDTGRVADHRHITKAVKEYNKMKKGKGMNGGNIFEDIADGFKKIGHFATHDVLPIVEKGADVASKVIPIAEKVAPMVAAGNKKQKKQKHRKDLRLWII